MRHQQFITHTITQGLFPTVGPQLAAGPASAFKLLGRSQLKVQDGHADHHCRVMFMQRRV